MQSYITSMENLFNITATDIKAKLNPTNNSTAFLGAQSAISSDDVDTKILEKTSYVCDRLRPRYHKLLTTVDEWICGRGTTNGGAIGGETSFQTTLYPITDIQLFKNFKGYWANRKSSDALEIETDYEVAISTGQITLVEPLTKGDTLIAYYTHNGMADCLTLKMMVINLVVADYAKILSLNEQKLNSYLEMENQTYIDLQRLYGDGEQGRLNLSFFDRIPLVNETVNDETSGTANLNYNSGMF